MISDVLFALVAAAHLWFMTLEMFLWEKPLGLKTFRQTREQAATTAVLAKNQGLYNGFLAAGIVWSFFEGHETIGQHGRLFFGGCVVVAGVYGALSTGKSTILFIQALPAAIACGALLAGF